MVSTKAMFTFTYILIVYILSVNGIIYKLKSKFTNNMDFNS